MDVIGFAWSEGTLAMYGTGVLVFHVFCDEKRVPDAQRAPASSLLMTAFLASAAGAYSGATLAAYFYGVRAWHLIHGARWALNQDEMSTMLKAVKKLTPASSKRDAREPFTVDLILSIRAQLSLAQPVSVNFTIELLNRSRLSLLLTTTIYHASSTPLCSRASPPRSIASPVSANSPS